MAREGVSEVGSGGCCSRFDAVLTALNQFCPSLMDWSDMSSLICNRIVRTGLSKSVLEEVEWNSLTGDD